MPTTLVTVLVGTVVVSPLAVHAVRYGAAAWRRRHAAAAGPAAATIVRLIVAEAVATWWLLLAAALPRRRPFGDPDAAGPAILILAPPPCPARALRPLARRLAAAGSVVDCIRVPRRPGVATLARIAWRGDRLRRGTRQPALAIVCVGRAAAVLPALSSYLAPSRTTHAVVLGAAPPPVVAGLPAIWIRATDDPWDTGTAAPCARLPTIVLHGVGHLSLLVAPHVATIVWEACASAPPS